MDNGLFREKSLERISSPEALHDYMRVTSPRLWMILATVVLLLAGFIVYASTARMENTETIRVQVENYQVPDDETGAQEEYLIISSSLPASYQDVVKNGMELRLLNETGHVVGISSFNEGIVVIFEMDNKNRPISDGEYDAELVLESTTPISFLWN